MKSGYSNFGGTYARRVKEPDFCFVPLRDGAHLAFPSVVGEAGWTEPGQRLREDRALKQVGSLGEVRVVILLKVFEPNVRSKRGSRFRSGAPSREV